MNVKNLLNKFSNKLINEDIKDNENILNEMCEEKLENTIKNDKLVVLTDTELNDDLYDEFFGDFEDDYADDSDS